MGRQEARKSFDFDAVILIDMQTGFIKKLREGASGRLIDNQKKVLKHCAQNNIPVIVLEFHAYDTDYGNTDPQLAEIVTTLSHCITLWKEHDSGFSNPELDDQLRKWEVSKLLLMGINAEFCVLETARDALEKGYEIVTSPELISGMPIHDANDCIDWYSQNGTLITL